MNLNQLMTNPYAWIILSFCTVAAFIFAIYTWIAGKRKKEITYFKKADIIVEGGRSRIPELYLRYQNKEIDDLTITRFVVWNSGNEVLNWEDIVKTKALRFWSKNEGVKILDARIVGQSEDTNMFQVTNVEETNVDIIFDYMDALDGVVVQILHTGASVFLEFDCKIKGGKDLRDLKKNKKKRKSKIRRTLDLVLIGIDILALVVLSFVLTLVQWKIIPEEAIAMTVFQENIILNIIFSIVLAIALGSVIIYYIRIVKEIYHLDIPTKLRNIFESEE